MDCFVHPNRGNPKVWCIDIHSPTELVVHFGLCAQSLKTRIIKASNPHAEMQKRIAAKIRKGYREMFGYIDQDGYFVGSSTRLSNSEQSNQNQPTKPKEQTQSFDLSKLKNGNSVWF